MLTPHAGKYRFESVSARHWPTSPPWACPASAWSPRTARSRVVSAAAAVLVSLTFLGTVLAVFASASGMQPITGVSTPSRQQPSPSMQVSANAGRSNAGLAAPRPPWCAPLPERSLLLSILWRTKCRSLGPP